MYAATLTVYKNMLVLLCHHFSNNIMIHIFFQMNVFSIIFKRHFNVELQFREREN